MERINTGERLESNVFNSNSILHLHRYAVASEYVINKIVLDIASGEGYGSNILSKQAEYVYGVDIDAESVKHAQLKYKKENLTYLVGSTSKIPLAENTVDVVVSFETLEHHDEHEKMMEEIIRVLKPNGTLIISTPDKKYYSDIPNYKNQFHVKELYKEEFSALLQQYFTYFQLFSQNYLNGNSHLINTIPQNNVHYYTGDFNQLKNTSSYPEFLVAIASNKKLLQHTNSIFDGSTILPSRKDVQVNKFKNTLDYKLGQKILSPLRFIKAIFKNFVHNSK